MRWSYASGIAACALACGHAADRSIDGGRVGASIALLADGRVAVVNPDQGSVSFVDPVSLATIATIAVAGEPHALLQAKSGRLFVATYRGGEIVAIDPSSGGIVARKSVCAGAYGLAESPDGSWLTASCEWDGTALRIDEATLATTIAASGLRRPRAVAIDGSDIVVADYVGGNLHRIDSSGNDSVTSLVPTSAPYRPALTTMTANLTAAITPAFGALQIAHVLENNTGNTTAELVADDYGTVGDANPKINPAITSLGSNAPVLYATFDGGPRVFSGPVAIAPFGTHELLVANMSTANVAVIDLSNADPKTRVIGSYNVGAGPSGIAIDEANHVAFVDNALDLSISRIDLTQPLGATAPNYPADATLIRDLPSPYSADALAGRRLFFDATNTHVTPSGVVACSSCHPGGSDDGLVWFEHTAAIPLRRRSTPHLANSKSTTAPFHWDGQFATMSDLVFSTVTDLMGGDGLLIQPDTIQAYIDEIVHEPVVTPPDPDAVARGEALFTSRTVGCSGCHSGVDTTDDMMHAPLDPMSLSADDDFTAANTPGLRGIFLSAPYLHDGRATDLHDLLTRTDAAGMGHANALTSDQLDDLIAYLKSL